MHVRHIILLILQVYCVERRKGPRPKAEGPNNQQPPRGRGVKLEIRGLVVSYIIIATSGSDTRHEPRKRKPSDAEVAQYQKTQNTVLLVLLEAPLFYTRQGQSQALAGAEAPVSIYVIGSFQRKRKPLTKPSYSININPEK